MLFPATKTAIQALMAQRGLGAKARSLGQCFLVEASIAQLIADAAELPPGAPVLEIGPGPGGLTSRLLAAGLRVLAVETDRGWAAFLHEAAVQHPGLTVLEGDALAGKHALNPALVEGLRALGASATAPFAVVANLPFHISSPLVANLLECPLPWRRMVLLVQREFALRVCAAPGTRAWGVLSVLAAHWARAETLRAVSRRAFWPSPRVDAAVLRLDPRRASRGVTDDYRRFKALVQTLFRQRRKTLAAALRRWGDAQAGSASMPGAHRGAGVPPAAALAALGLDGTRRAETLSYEELWALAGTLGEPWQPIEKLVAPAKAGIQELPSPWIPARPKAGRP